MEKEKLINLIKNTNNEDIIKYLYAFSKDFIARRSLTREAPLSQSSNQSANQ